jgi:hypothetical protein
MTWAWSSGESVFALELLPLDEEAIEFLFISLIADYLVQVSPRLHEIEHALLRALGAYCPVSLNGTRAEA